MRDNARLLRQVADWLEALEIEHKAEQSKIAEDIAGLMDDLNQLQRKLEKADYENGRLEYKIANQEKTIAEQRQKIRGLQEVDHIRAAHLAAIVKNLGRIDIHSEDVKAGLQGEIQVEVSFDEATRIYSLKIADKTEA